MTIPQIAMRYVRLETLLEPDVESKVGTTVGSAVGLVFGVAVVPGVESMVGAVGVIPDDVVGDDESDDELVIGSTVVAFVSLMFANCAIAKFTTSVNVESDDTGRLCPASLLVITVGFVYLSAWSSVILFVMIQSHSPINTIAEML